MVSSAAHGFSAAESSTGWNFIAIVLLSIEIYGEPRWAKSGPLLKINRMTLLFSCYGFIERREQFFFRVSEEIVMQTPEWLKPAVYGAACGAIGLAVVGFSWGGWVTGGTARTMAAEQAKI